MSTARQFHRIAGEFVMEHGGTLVDPVIAFETWGEINFQKDNAVLLFTGMSPSAHAASSALDTATGWWEQMVGPHKPIDTTKYFVICVNSLGSCFGSTGPASTNLATGKRFGIDFPVLTIEDIAKSAQEVVKSLELTRLHAVVGASMGGMSALAHSILFPDVADGLVCISSAARALPYSIGLRSLQREIIRRDPEWRGGHYKSPHGPVRAMRLARKLGMLTYRSAQEFEQRFGRERVKQERASGDTFGIDFEVESYLEAHAEKFTGTFDANCYLYLSRAMDLFDVADYGGSVEYGLKRVGARRALVVGVTTDILFPLKQQEELARGLETEGREVDFRALPSLQGHDSFLVDMDRFRPVLCDFFNCSMNQPGQLRTA